MIRDVVETLVNLGDKIVYFGFSRTLIGCQACYYYSKLLDAGYGKNEAKLITFLKIVSDALTRLAWFVDHNFDCTRCIISENLTLFFAIEHNMAVSSPKTETVLIEPFATSSIERVEEGLKYIEEIAEKEGKKMLFERVYMKCFVCMFIRTVYRYFREWKEEELTLLLLSVLRHACAYGFKNKCKNCQIVNVKVEEHPSPIQRKPLDEYRFKINLVPHHFNPIQITVPISSVAEIA